MSLNGVRSCGPGPSQGNGALALDEGMLLGGTLHVADRA
jgi:hypothetical protein